MGLGSGEVGEGVMCPSRYKTSNWIGESMYAMKEVRAVLVVVGMRLVKSSLMVGLELSRDGSKGLNIKYNMVALYKLLCGQFLQFFWLVSFFFQFMLVLRICCSIDYLGNILDWSWWWMFNIITIKSQKVCCKNACPVIDD